MKKQMSLAISAICMILMAGCSGPKYTPYQFDNGDDYFCDGVRRIVNGDGKIGFADEKGNVTITPKYAFAFPFENGKAKVTFEGRSVEEGEYHRWVSSEWFFIDHSGERIAHTDRSELETSLTKYVAGKDARIGIAVIIDGTDTVAVNGNRDFPMMSVFKFPEALAVADFCLKNDISLSDSISIAADEIKENTWSPMREKYGVGDMSLPIDELIDFILMHSDNNASDILFRMIGGPAVADSLMKSIGYDDITIACTEDEMHKDPYLCYLNRSTPIEMARLFDRFYRRDMRYDSAFHEFIAQSMISCQTGLDRLASPLKSADATIGHKTGTGDKNSQGRIMAVNDAGYVFLPGGHGYAIAVFIADSAYDMPETEKMIADISDIVFKSLK